ncbi:MAG: hybrid sensor histidine kinase/response regulator [Bacteroidales bacterium]|nr:hybrid sensor histidine kinase/response regulator [Bacteroidales bacterium]
MEKLRILIVDDEQGIRTGIRRGLRGLVVSFPFHDDDFEYDIIDAETGEEALSIIENELVDIVLLDNKLPGIEGIEVLEIIKERKYDLSVMMITSYASIELAVKATNNGAFNFVPKPFTKQELTTAIESITKHLFLKRMTRKMKAEGKKIRFQFLSVLSHELKSPINTVESYLRIIQDRQAGDNIDAYDTMVKRSLDRLESMRTLIMDMLDFTRIESGRKARNITDIDIIDIAKTAIYSVEIAAKAKGIHILMNFPKTLYLKADASDFEIIFNNLLSNAVKYNKESGEIIISINEQDSQIKIVVEDTGIGMNVKEKSHLFEEFMRAKNVKTRNISGTGLGLSIMKKIVDLNKGSIEVESTPDIGSKFTVII